jgi:hypothetical protein
VGKQANWTAWASTRSQLDEVSYTAFERKARVSQVIAAPKSSECRTLLGPQPAALEKSWELFEIEVEHEERKLEGVFYRSSPAMPHTPLVDATFHR